MIGSWISIRIRSGLEASAAATPFSPSTASNELEAGVREQVAQDPPIVLGILDHQDGVCSRQLSLLVDTDRNDDAEGRAYTERRNQVDTTAVHADEAPGD